jgi:DNA-binding IclR family transcriptional regulator
MFCQRAGPDLVCLDVETGAFAIKTLPMDIGSRRPLGCGAAGNAVLAALQPAESDRIAALNLPRLETGHGVSATELAAAVAACREAGHAVFPEDPKRRTAGVAVALIDRRGRPQGAIAVASIADRMDAPRRAGIAALLTDQARGIEEAMWRLPDQQRHRMRWARSPAPSHDFDMQNRSDASCDV